MIDPGILAVAIFEAECGQPPANWMARTSMWEDRVNFARKVIAALDKYAPNDEPVDLVERYGSLGPLTLPG